MGNFGLNKPHNGLIPLVSVCITTYNHEPYIIQSLDSVLAQETDFDFEILLGEDDSSDSTRAICIEYAEKYPDRIRLFLNDRENVIYINGIATGRWNFINNIESARGKYIALLEGDDYWVDPLKLKKQVDILDGNLSAAGCFHETQMIMQDRTIGNIYGKSKKDILNVNDTIAIASPFHTSSFIFRRSFLPSPIPGWFRKVVSGDMALFMMLACKGPLISVPEIMSIYRKHAGGMTENSTLKNKYHIHRIKLLQYFDRYTSGKYRETINMVINHHRLSMARSKMKTAKDKFSLITKLFKAS